MPTESSILGELMGDYPDVKDGDVPAEQLMTDPINLDESAIPAPLDDQLSTDERISDDQDDDSGEVVDSSDDDDDKPKRTNWKKRFEELQVESNGRLNQITELRHRMSEQSQHMEELREMFMKQEERAMAAEREEELQRQLEEEAALYGEDVVNDPGAAYLRDKLEELREQQMRWQQDQTTARQQVLEQSRNYAEQQRTAQAMLERLRNQEAQFAEKHPDYDDAYQFARNHQKNMFMQRGYNAQQAESLVSQQEQALFYEQMQRGGDVAQVIYNLAKDMGYRGKAAQPETQQAQARRAVDSPNMPDMVSRQRAGIKSRGIGQMDGNNAGKGDPIVTTEQFYSRFTPAERIEIYNLYPQVFENLGRHGKTTLPF